MDDKMKNYFGYYLVVFSIIIILTDIPALGKENIYIMRAGKYELGYVDVNWEPHDSLVNVVDSNLYLFFKSIDTGAIDIDNNNVSIEKYHKIQKIKDIKTITKTFFEYKRQYFGNIKDGNNSEKEFTLTINASFENPNELIEINLIRKKKGLPSYKACDYSKVLCTAFGGGASYWSIIYNGNTKKFENLGINAQE